jgi:hypothetical protein
VLEAELFQRLAGGADPSGLDVREPSPNGFESLLPLPVGRILVLPAAEDLVEREFGPTVRELLVDEAPEGS